MTDPYPLGADCDIDAIREARVTPCRMRQQYPFDFAWCETHDETFPLGSVCRFNRLDFPASGAGMVAGSNPGLPATPTPSDDH